MQPPGPPAVTYHPWSLLPHVRRMGRDPTLEIGRRFARYGDLYQARFFGRDVFATRDAELVKQILITQADVFGKPREGIVVRQLKRLLGNGLLLSEGELWRRQRRLIQPAFRRERLLQYAELVITLSEEFVRAQKDGAHLDVSRSMMELTLRIVAKALFDKDASADVARVAHATQVFRSGFAGLGALLPRWLPTARNRGNTRALADLDALIYALIDEHHGEGVVSALANGTGMERTLIRDELITLLLAGHETTSHALSWTFHLLARHPHVESRVRAEAQAVFGERRPQASDLDKLVYTEQVLSEAMRLFPPAYVLARVANRDTELGGYAMAKGTDAIIWIYHVHHHPAYWPDPERFDPDRFAPERKSALVEGAYLPFGLGTRTCIGKHFALMEAKLVLACTLRELSFRDGTLKPVTRDLAVTLAPHGGLPMRVERTHSDT
ncbi:MAG TPA: cytochrome P450 [Polyangiales bacterium]|nr:cytochrome P450 [Polyangiales bacterium]